MTFFKPYGWLGRAFRRAESRKPNVNESWWIAECERLLKGPITDEDRRRTEDLRQAWLASREAGC